MVAKVLKRTRIKAESWKDKTESWKDKKNEHTQYYIRLYHGSAIHDLSKIISQP